MPHKDPEKRKQYLKEYREKTKEREKIRQAEYRALGKYKKSTTISGWKYKGLIEDDYDAIYEKWISIDKCDCCKVKFAEGSQGKANTRCMDHCHKTGKFRNVLCQNCNFMRHYLDNNYQAYVRMLTLPSARTP